jgi:hypothetical protein
VVSLIEIKLDDQPLELSKLMISMHDKEFPFSELENVIKQPICLGDIINVIYKGKVINPGPHQIEFKVNLPDPVIFSAELEFV